MEQGPIRPPSEAGSLLVRVTRGCFYNRCAFCTVYKDCQPSARSTEEILADLDEAVAMVEEVRHLAALGGAEGVDRRAVYLAHRHAPHLAPVAFWLYRGGRTVFLQDADALGAPEERVLAALQGIRERFPFVERVTTYARARTLARQPLPRLQRYQQAGLSRVHLGLESGSDAVLSLVDKGCTSAHQVEGGRRVVEAGLHLCAYVMPGLGGEELAREHVAETARVLTEIRPAVVRLRSLRVLPGTPLEGLVEEGLLRPRSELDVVGEIRDLLVALGGLEVELVSDHDLNLLPELRGRLPGDRAWLLARVEDLMSWPPARQRLFILGRRAGLVHGLADLKRRESDIEDLALRLGVDLARPEDEWLPLVRSTTL